MMSNRGGMTGSSHSTGSNRPEWLQSYDLIGKIGEGTYGLVFLARINSPGSNRGKSIAIKKVKQSKDGDGVSPTAIREIMDLRSDLCIRVFSCPRCTSKFVIAGVNQNSFSNQ